MPAYLYQAPTGIPGDITRPDKSTVEPAMLVALAGVFAQAYGAAMAYVAGGIQQFTTGYTAANFAGVLVREVPTISGNTDGTFSGDIPNPLQPAGLCPSGYVNVLCTQGTPARGGVVYVRVAAASGRPIGAFEAVSDGGNSVALSFQQASWASDGLDANLNAELRVNVP